MTFFKKTLQIKPNFTQSNLELAFTFVNMKGHPEIMHIKFLVVKFGYFSDQNAGKLTYVY